MKNDVKASFRIPNALDSEIDKASTTPENDELISFINIEMRNIWGVQTNPRGSKPSSKTALLRYCLHTGWLKIKAEYFKDTNFDQVEISPENDHSLKNARDKFFLSKLRKESPQTRLILEEVETIIQESSNPQSTPISLSSTHALLWLTDRYDFDISSLKAFLDTYHQLNINSLIRGLMDLEMPYKVTPNTENLRKLIEELIEHNSLDVLK